MVVRVVEEDAEVVAEEVAVEEVITEEANGGMQHFLM